MAILTSTNFCLQTGLPFKSTGCISELSKSTHCKFQIQFPQNYNARTSILFYIVFNWSLGYKSWRDCWPFHSIKCDNCSWTLGMPICSTTAGVCGFHRKLMWQQVSCHCRHHVQHFGFYTFKHNIRCLTKPLWFRVQVICISQGTWSKKLCTNSDEDIKWQCCTGHKVTVLHCA